MIDVSNIKLSDVKRILMGDAPYAFLLEVVVRTLIIYCVLVVVMRLMGKRMSGQLTLTEMAVMIALGAIISVPAQVMDRGILPGALLLFLILIFQRGLTYTYHRNPRIEEITQGKDTLLVKNGIIQVRELTDAKITREQLFAILRSQEVYHLGMVKRVYQEACGVLSIYREEHPKPGLSVLPKPDTGIIATPTHPDNGLEACISCGNTDKITSHGTPHVCIVCGSDKWEPVVQ